MCLAMCDKLISFQIFKDGHLSALKLIFKGPSIKIHISGVTAEKFKHLMLFHSALEHTGFFYKNALLNFLSFFHGFITKTVIRFSLK